MAKLKDLPKNVSMTSSHTSSARCELRKYRSQISPSSVKASELHSSPYRLNSLIFMMLVKDELLLGNLGRVLVGDSEIDPAVSDEMDVLRCRVVESVMTRESWSRALMDTCRVTISCQALVGVADEQIVSRRRIDTGESS